MLSPIEKREREREPRAYTSSSIKINRLDRQSDRDCCCLFVPLRWHWQCLVRWVPYCVSQFSTLFYLFFLSLFSLSIFALFILLFLLWERKYHCLWLLLLMIPEHNSHFLLFIYLFYLYLNRCLSIFPFSKQLTCLTCNIPGCEIWIMKFVVYKSANKRWLWHDCGLFLSLSPSLSLSLSLSQSWQEQKLLLKGEQIENVKHV